MCYNSKWIVIKNERVILVFKDAEKRVTKKGFVTYWKDGVMIGRKCTKCGEDKSISEFGIANRKKNQYRPDCKKCHAKATREYEINNPERRKEYYENNAEKIKEYSREHYRKNWERHRENNRQWIRNNPEKNRAKSRKWARENPEYEKEYHERLRTENIQKISILSDAYSTVTDFARLRGLSMSQPFSFAT